MPKKTIQTTIRLEPELHEAAKKKAAAKDLSLAHFIRVFLRQWVAENGDQKAAQAQESK